MYEGHFVDVLFRGFTTEELIRFLRIFLTALGQLICQRSTDAIFISTWVIFKQLAQDPFAGHHNQRPRRFIIIAFSFRGYKTWCKRQFNPWGLAFIPVFPFFVVLCDKTLGVFHVNNVSFNDVIDLVFCTWNSAQQSFDFVVCGRRWHFHWYIVTPKLHISQNGIQIFGRKLLQEILSLLAVWDTLHSRSLNVFDVIKLFGLNVSDVPPCVTEDEKSSDSVHSSTRDLQLKQ